MLEALGGGYDHYIGWDISLKPFARFGGCLTSTRLASIMDLPVVCAPPQFYGKTDPEWCNEEYNSGYSTVFETYVYLPFSALD